MGPSKLHEEKKILKDVIALVEVKSSLGNPALAISSRLQSLGATVVRSLSPSVTHVIFRNGSENIWQSAKKANVHVVCPSWVKACQTYKFRVNELSYRVMEKPDCSMLESVENSEVTANPDNIQELCDPSATTLADLSVAPIVWQPRKPQALEPLPVPKEVTKFLQRREKQRPVRLSHDMFSTSELSSNDEKDASSVSPLVARTHPAVHPLSEVSVMGCCPSHANTSAKVMVASTQNEGAPTNHFELSGNVSPVRRTSAIVGDRTKLPKEIACHTHRRLLPLDRGEQNPADRLITPVGKTKSGTPTFPKVRRSPHMSSKLRHLSAKTPLTADLLLDVVQSSHTPKSFNKARRSEIKTPRSNHRTPRLRRPIRCSSRESDSLHFASLAKAGHKVDSAPQSVRTRAGKKRVSFSNASSLEFLKNQTNITKPHSSIPCSRKQSDEVRSIDNPVSGTLLRVCVVPVDMDASECPATLSTPVSLRQPTSCDLEQKSATRNAQRDKKCTPSVSVSSAVDTKFQRKNLRKNQQMNSVSFKRRSALPNLPLTDKPSNSSGTIRPLTTRNSLDDFDLSSRLKKRRNHRAAQMDSPLCSSGALVIGFTGLRRDEEQTLRSLIITSQLTGYRFADICQTCVSAATQSDRGHLGCTFEKEMPTHLVTPDPYRRTLNFMFGLLHGVTIVTEKWVRGSAQCGFWISAADFKPSELPRQCRQGELSTLFSAHDPIYVGPIQRPPTSALIKLLKLAGAKIAHRKAAASVLIGCSKSGAICLKPDWVLDSIVLGRIQPMAQYMLSALTE